MSFKLCYNHTSLEILFARLRLFVWLCPIRSLKIWMVFRISTDPYNICATYQINKRTKSNHANTKELTGLLRPSLITWRFSTLPLYISLTVCRVSPSQSVSPDPCKLVLSLGSISTHSTSAAVRFKSGAVRKCTAINQAGHGKCAIIEKQTHMHRRAIECWTVDALPKTYSRSEILESSYASVTPNTHGMCRASALARVGPPVIFLQAQRSCTISFFMPIAIMSLLTQLFHVFLWSLPFKLHDCNRCYFWTDIPSESFSFWILIFANV